MPSLRYSKDCARKLRFVRYISSAVIAAAFWLAAVNPFHAAAQSQSSEKSPSASSASALPQDSHDNMTITAEPFAEAEKAKQKFGNASPQKAGILAVNVTFHNNNARAVQIDLDSIELDVQDSNGQKQALEPMDIVQVAENIAYPGGLKEPSTRRFPLGIGGSSPDKKVQKIVDELKPFTLDGDIVASHEKLQGCVYFNLAHQMHLAATADLYIPDIVTLPDKKPLLFFDIPLGSGASVP
jgi:hypothetical protein